MFSKGKKRRLRDIEILEGNHAGQNRNEFYLEMVDMSQSQSTQSPLACK
jgi:hypothetical protein